MKLINSITFYIILATGIIFTLNNEFNFYNILGIAILGSIFVNMLDSSKQEIYDILGITWLQKKFKNNKVIMDMTKE